MGLEVLGIANDKGRVDDCGERFVGEISTVDWSTLVQVERGGRYTFVSFGEQ